MVLKVNYHYFLLFHFSCLLVSIPFLLDIFPLIFCTSFSYCYLMVVSWIFILVHLYYLLFYHFHLKLSFEVTVWILLHCCCNFFLNNNILYFIFIRIHQLFICSRIIHHSRVVSSVSSMDWVNKLLLGLSSTWFLTHFYI